MERILNEKLWDRNNNLPLLFEVISREGGFEGYSNILESAIQLRSQAAFSIDISERIEVEKKLSLLVAQIERQSERAEKLNSSPQFLALKNEYNKGVEEIKIALNDYNFCLEKFASLLKWPWFKIYSFGFEIAARQPLGWL